MTGRAAPKFSIVIPYRQRLDNVRLAFASLAEQTLDADEFEVIVGAMEYSGEYIAACREFTDRLRITSVVSAEEWQVGYARNLALRQATGQVVICLDADMIVPPSFLAKLWDRYYAYGQNVCVAGQMTDYDNNATDVSEVRVLPFDHYRKLFAELEGGAEVPADARRGTEHVIPWAYAWTALVAVPRALIEEHDLTFDPAFKGYGVEDLEWAYRISRTGTPIVMAPDIYGIHLPHVRNVAANRDTEQRNYRYFVGKWPDHDVELAAAFGDFEANGLAREFRAELTNAAGGGRDASLAVVRGRADGADTLIVGAVVDGAGALVGEPAVAALLDPGAPVEVLPLAGVALPWADGSLAACRVLPPVARLAPKYRDAVLAEAARVAGDVREVDAA
ncbi:glycosyltransferase family 2 protein [Streptomyces litchfieldiae]|uniref:Glycosyltransferase n=1 Tax=Streptomyces litchfieldiae TaxID=3075543 RepID=A0ABU2MUG1_9ACTN|nr:glycosyltransferase [Streptomyces sp. DSM 44938]MDT0345106.1 glycosyltransferase [Streptomyces sp. DSM 44938]